MFLRRLQAALKRMGLFPFSPEMPYTILISWGKGQKKYSRHPFIFLSLLELEGLNAMAWHYGLRLFIQVQDPVGLGPWGGAHPSPRPVYHPSRLTTSASTLCLHMHFQLPAFFTMVTKASALCFPKSKTGKEPKEMNVFPMGPSFATYYLDNKS